MGATGVEVEPFIDKPQNCNIAYGCLFCISGKELFVAESIERRSHFVQARAVCQTKRITKKGKTELCTNVVLHGYVMLKAIADLDINREIPQEGVISLLTYSDGNWCLFGEDEEYAKWVFKNDGVIGLSKAYTIGDRITIIDGPLKELEGRITRIDRRNKNGQVTIMFGGREIKVWLGFEIIEE